MSGEIFFYINLVPISRNIKHFANILKMLAMYQVLCCTLYMDYVS